MIIEKHLDSEKSGQPIVDTDIEYVTAVMKAIDAGKLFIER